MNEAGASDTPWSRAFAWIESELGGRVVASERQARWRPAFFLDLERGDATLPLYFRGARPEIANGERALEHEARVLRQLEASGIPVPHVYGLCPDPPGIVMERSPGRSNLATAACDSERQAVLNDYIDILARMHRLDVAPFEKLGMPKPETPEQLGFCDLAVWEKTYRTSKQRPEPIIEFVLTWLRRNVPEGRSRVGFLAADAGQFMFEDSRVTALLDLELACLGDPAADLGGMRGRDLSEPLGDLPTAFRRYFELTGEEIPTPVIDYHTVRFGLYTPMAVAPLVAAPPPGIDLVQYLAWYWVWSRACLEVMAAGMQVPLTPPELPGGAATRYAPVHDGLVGTLQAAAAGEGHAAYEADSLYRSAEYLRRAERFGAELDASEGEDVGNLLGRRIHGWSERDAALETFAASAGPERDAEIVQLLHRRTLRNEFLLEPVLRELSGVSIQLL